MASGRYRFIRGLLRAWLAIFFGAIRVLQAESAPESGPLLLLVNHPAGFLEALILIAALERQVHCALPRPLIQGAWRSLIARGLGMTPYAPSDRAGAMPSSLVDSCCGVLLRGAAVAIFVEPQIAESSEPPRLALTAASVAIEAESRHAGALGLSVVPLHVFLPTAPARTTEPLLYIDRPQSAVEYSSRHGTLADRALAFATDLEATCRDNAFRLQPRDLSLLLSDLEGVLRTELQAEWGSRPNWRQSVEEFRVSGFLTEFIEQLNCFNPGRLVALSEQLRAYQREQRQGALRELEVQAASWYRSYFSRTLVWLESLVGLPVACYGLINHLLAGGALWGARLLPRKSDANVGPAPWVIRGLVTVAFYTLQIWLCAHFLGRAAAGYYAVSLPVSGLYGWRYVRLLDHRTRLAFYGLRAPYWHANLHEMRRNLLQELDRARDVYAGMLGLPTSLP